MLTGQTMPMTLATGRAKWTAFIRLARVKFLVYSMLLVGLGAAAAVVDGRVIDVALFVHGLVVVWLGHVMTHFVNEYFDYEADAANPSPTKWTGGSRVLVEGKVSRETAIGLAFVLLFVCAGLIVAMPYTESRWVALFTAFNAWFYVAPPLRFNYRGLGEVTVAVSMNVLLPCIGYGLQSEGRFSPLVLAVALPTGLVQAGRMLTMNLADREGDIVVNKRTLAVYLGRASAQRVIAGSLGLALVAIVVLLLVGKLPLAPAVGMLATAPIAVWHARRILSGALFDPTRANSVVFWASTHQAFVVAGAAVGMVVEAARRIPADGASLRLLIAILVAFFVVVFFQMRKN